MKTMKVEKNMDVDDLLVVELRNRINNYFFIVVRNLRDLVPKLIGQFLVKKFNDSLEVDILNALNQKNYCIENMFENKGKTSERDKLKKEMIALTKAESLLVNDFGMGFNVINEISKKDPYSSKKIQINQESGLVEDLELLGEIHKINDEFLLYNQELVDKERERLIREFENLNLIRRNKFNNTRPDQRNGRKAHHPNQRPNNNKTNHNRPNNQRNTQKNTHKPQQQPSRNNLVNRNRIDSKVRNSVQANSNIPKPQPRRPNQTIHVPPNQRNNLGNKSNFSNQRNSKRPNHPKNDDKRFKKQNTLFANEGESDPFKKNRNKDRGTIQPQRPNNPPRESKMKKKVKNNLFSDFF